MVKLESANIILSTSKSYKLQFCDPNCETCLPSNPLLCLKCLPGFMLNTFASSNLCSPCGVPCKTCSDGNSSICLSCFADEVLLNDTCYKCKSPCLTCISSSIGLGTCTTCPDGYALTNGTCITVDSKSVCDISCAQCMSKASSWTCLSCLPGFALVSGKCAHCIQSCKVCSSSNVTKCFECLSGFYLDTYTHKCISCSDPNCQ